MRRTTKLGRVLQWPSENGFSLIELMIVVAVILILAAIAIPNYLRARIAANEASAAGSMRQIATAELSYNTTYPSVGYSALPNLGGALGVCVPTPAAACILDSVLSAGNKSGYTFAAVPTVPVNGANTQFTATGVPQGLNVTGVKAYCVTEDGVIRYITPSGGPADHATCLGPTYAPIPQ